MSEQKQSTLDAILAQYEKNSSSNSNYSQKTYDLKNYFTTFLDKGIKEASRVIRILPPSEGQKTPFVEVMVHKIKINGEYKTFICPKHEDSKDCPFCEARELLLAEGKESDKELAKKYSAKKTYVAKVIDRDKEMEGVKFWRFNHDYRRTGTLDKIVSIIQEVGDITNPNTGRDLTIKIARDTNGIPVIQNIIQKDSSKLVTNKENYETAKAWLADSRTWKDVFSIKPYDYLKIIVEGGEPVWDKINEKWVNKSSIKSENIGNETNDLNSELEMGKNKINDSNNTTSENGEDMDLPF